MVQLQEEIDKVQQILDMQNQGNSSEGSQSQRTKPFERTKKQPQTRKRQLRGYQGQQYDQEGKDKHQKLINPPSPQGRHEGDISTNRSQPQPIQVLKDASSSNSSDPPELLCSEMELLNCGCTRCHREGQNNISTDICAKDRILQLCNQLNELKTQVKELSLIKEGLMAWEELQPKEFNLEERVKAKNVIIKRLKDTLIDMINKIRKFFFKEDPIQKEVTEEQLQCFCQETANKCVQNLIKAFEQLNNKSKSSEDETVNIVITDFPSETQMPENIRNELQGSRKKIEQMEKQIQLKKGELEVCLEQQFNYRQSLTTKDHKIQEYEQKERQWTNFMEQKDQSIQSLTNQIQQKIVNLSQMDEAFAALKKDYDFLQDKKKQLEEECDVNNDKIQELQRSKNDLQEKYSTALQTIEGQKQQIEGHQSSAIKNQTSWQTQKTTLERLAQKLEEERDVNNDKIQELQRSKNDLQEKYSNALQTIKGKQQQIEQHKSSASKNQALWQTQKTTLERLTQDQLQAKQQHLKATLQKIRQQNIKFKQVLAQGLEELKKKSESDLNEQIQQRQKEMEEASTRYKETIKTIRENANSEIELHKQQFQVRVRAMKDEHMGQLTQKQDLNSQLSKNNQQLQATIQQLETKICQFIKQHDKMLKFYNTSFGNFITTQRRKSLDAHNDHQNNYATLIQTILALEEENGTMKNNIDLLMKDYLDTLLLSRTSAQEIEELSLLNVQLTAEKKQLVSSHNERTHLLQKKIQQIELAYKKSYNQMCQIQQNHYKQAVEAQTTVLNARITLLENQLRCQSQISTEAARLASCQQSFNEMEIGELKGQLAAEKERHQRTAKKYKNHKEELMDQVSRYEQTADDFHNQKIALEINLKQYETLVERINKTVSNFLDQVGSQPLQVLLSAASSSFEQNIDSLYRLTNTFSIFYEQVTVRAISVENKNSQLQNQIDSLSLQNSELKSSAQMNGQDLTLKVKEVETKLKIVEKQLEQTNTDRQNLKATVATAQRQLKQLKLKDKQSEKTIFLLNSKIEQFASSNSKQSNRANEILSQKDGKIMQLTTKLTQFEAQKKQLSNQLESITRENSKLKNEAFALKEEERKSVSLKKNQQNKIRESEILQDQYLTQKLKTQQQNEKLQRKSQQYEKQIADLKRKILENETQMQSNRNTFESTISKREHLSQIQQFQTIVQQQKMKIQKLERSSQSMITESVYNRKEDEMQQIIDKLQRQKAILQEKYREAQIGFKKEKESPVSLARVNSQKILKSFSPEESAFLNMFSSRTLLDLPQHQAKKELLIKTILDRTGKELKETSLSFSYSLKNRTFHTSITKAVLTNDESYVFLFNSKGKDNSSNLFAITIYKTGQKNVPILAVLTLLSKEGTFQKRRDCSSTTLPISFDYSGTEVTFGATYKIKSGDTKLRTQLQSKYFDMPSPFVVFDKQSKEVQLQNFQIHKIVLE